MLPNERQYFTKVNKSPTLNAIQQLTQLVTQANRTKSVLQPTNKRIVEVQKPDNKTERVEKTILTTRDIHSQCSLRNYFENTTTKNNKENYPTKKLLNLDNRSHTPLSQKNPISINTRGRGSVSPLRQNQTAKSKTPLRQKEDPQIVDMVDNLKQNILRDLQEVTKRYQSNNSKPLEMLYKQNEKIKNMLDYKEPAIKGPYFDYSSSKDHKHRESQNNEDETSNKQQFLEQQSQILQQQLELIKQQQEVLKKQQQTVLHSKNNLPSFYNSIRKQKPNESTEDIYSKSQFTISNLSSIVPAEASTNQNKKINCSFDSSLGQNQLQLQLEIIKASDCRTTFGPSQLESIIKSPEQFEPELFNETNPMKDVPKPVTLDKSEGKVSSAKRYEGQEENQEQPIDQNPQPSAFSNKSNRYDQLIQNFQSLRKLSRVPSFNIETKKSVQMNDLNHISDFAILGSQRESIAIDCQTKLITFQEVNMSQEEKVLSPQSQFEQKSILSPQSQFDKKSFQQSFQQLSQQQSEQISMQVQSFQKESISIQQSTEQTNRIIDTIRSNESFKQRTASFTEFLRGQDEFPVRINTIQKIPLRSGISFLQYKQQNKN